MKTPEMHEDYCPIANGAKNGKCICDIKQVGGRLFPAKGMHTPGPWRVMKINSALTIVDSEGERVAQASSGKGLPSQTQEYNAGLIATAPDMLEALMDLHPLIAGDGLRARIGKIIITAKGEKP